jgi:hypothetical protein
LVLGVAMLVATPASANICRAEQLTCVTTMPVGGIANARHTAQPREAKWSAGPNRVTR